MKSPSKAAARLVHLARHRAKKRGIECALTPRDIKIPKRCPALGIPLVRNIGGRASHDASPTLDRIDASKGYVKGNVIVLSSKANRIKSNATLKELERVAAFVRRLVH